MQSPHPSLARLQERIQPLRESITRHPVYAQMRTLEQVSVFMEHHVFAVWDFMSLLKALQIHLTCVTLPWRPVGSAGTRYLINEIVAGEESDVDEEGQRCSHFELYLSAMRQAGASTAPVDDLLALLSEGNPVRTAIAALQLPQGIADFVNFTFDVIAGEKPHVIAAVFTFGREDLIPGMFHGLVSELSAAMPERISKFRYYLERHIEVDGDHHSHLALQMTGELCGDDPVKWEEAENAVIAALGHRKGLWDQVLASISN